MERLDNEKRFTMINQNHLERLLELDFKTGVGVEVLIKTITHKAIQYKGRDTQGQCYNPVTAHYDRALNVMEAYANRKMVVNLTEENNGKEN